MTQLLATTFKELLLLRRDRGGLLVLFVMPAVLVLVITLVQENVLKTVGESEIRILLVDRDSGPLGALIEQKLHEAGSLTVRRPPADGEIDEKQIAGAAARGDFQFCVVLPAGLSESARKASATVRPSSSVSMVSITIRPSSPSIRIEFARP